MHAQPKPLPNQGRAGQRPIHARCDQICHDVLGARGKPTDDAAHSVAGLPDRFEPSWPVVEPVIKVLHIPTTQPRIFAAISRPDSARPEVHCLLFSILFSATTALLSDDPTNEQIRMDLRRYQQGMELSIYNSSFLDSPTLSSIQAMTIYLVRGASDYLQVMFWRKLMLFLY